MGYKGFVQLCIRTGQYKTVNVAPVYEGDIKSHNRFTGEFEFNTDSEASGPIIGYLSYIQIKLGFEKYLYRTIDQLRQHGKRYSRSFRKNYGPWVDDFNAMCEKTMIKMILTKWGPLSIEMATAVENDGSSNKGEEISYPDFAEQEESPFEIEDDVQHVDDTKKINESTPELNENYYKDLLEKSTDDKAILKIFKEIGYRECWYYLASKEMFTDGTKLGLSSESVILTKVDDFKISVNKHSLENAADTA
jgi:recombination protein RecT